MFQFTRFPLSCKDMTLYRLLHSEDRKSTRLNSSHANISYAVFCLKKKKTIQPTRSGNHQTYASAIPTHCTKPVHTIVTVDLHRDELMNNKHHIDLVAKPDLSHLRH